MNIKIKAYPKDVRKSIEVEYSSYNGDVNISLVQDKTDYKDYTDDTPQVKEITTISLDNEGARQLLIALQKILF